MSHTLEHARLVSARPGPAFRPAPEAELQLLQGASEPPEEDTA